MILSGHGSGHGRVAVGLAARRSVVTSLTFKSPLHLLAPRNHGRAAWIYATSLGGGLVDGDALELTVDVDAGAAAYLTTQASTKIYRGSASQALTASVGEDALLVSLPDPVVAFAGARYRQRAAIALARGASLVWLEAVTAGRAARGERWQADAYRSHTRVDREGALFALDGLVLDAADGPVAARLGAFEALATLLVAGPAVDSLRGRLLGAGRDRGAVLVAPSPIAGDAAVIRVAADNPEHLARALGELLEPIADLLGDDPLARKGLSALDAMR